MTKKKRGMLDWYFKTSLLLRIFIGLVAGATLGLVLAGYDPLLALKVNGYLAPFGAAFIRLLKMIIIPVVLFTLVVGTSGTELSSLGRVGIKILIYYAITSVFAVLIALIAGRVFNPGRGIELDMGVTTISKSATETPLSQIILEIIPENIFFAFTNGIILQVIFYALALGISIAVLRESKDGRIKAAADAVFNVFDGLAEATFVLVGWVMQYAPIGVFSLMVGVFAINGIAVLLPLMYVIVVIYACLIVHLFLVYGGYLATQKISLFSFIKRAKAPMLTAFVTRSSGGTLPLTLKTAEKMGISRPVYAFTLPIGATVNMDGTTIYQVVCAVFIANAVGQPLSFNQMIIVLITAVLAAIGTAGVPGAGAIMLLLVLEAVGLKVEAGSAVAAAYAMILGIDAILDMGRTGMNVTGDIVGAVFVDSSEKTFNREVYDAYDGSID